MQIPREMIWDIAVGKKSGKIMRVLDAGPATMDELVDFVYDDYPPVNPALTIRVLIRYLRKNLAEYGLTIVSDNRYYRLVMGAATHAKTP
jgi:hypothetical protein